MNSCHHSKNIIAYRLGILSGAQKAAFEDHLRICTLCQHEMQVEAALDREMAEQSDPGDIESFIVSKVRLIKNMQPRASWQYLFQVVAYVAAAITLLWVFVPMIINLISTGGEGIARMLENYPAMPAGAIPLTVVGIGVLFMITSGLLAWRTLRK